MKHTDGILGDGTCGSGRYMLEKFVAIATASCDQQHPLIVSSILVFPDRAACLLFIRAFRHTVIWVSPACMLEDAGAECIVTSHATLRVLVYDDFGASRKRE